MMEGNELPPPDRLEGDGFSLRRWNVADAAWYVNARDEEIFRWTKESRDLTVSQAEAAIRQSHERPDVLAYAIIAPRSGDLLGNIALTFNHEGTREGEVMYWLAPSARGRGIATRAVILLCDWSFRFLRLERITLKTLPENVRSQRVAQRAGFHLSQGESAPDYLWFVKYEMKETSRDG